MDDAVIRIMLQEVRDPSAPPPDDDASPDAPARPDAGPTPFEPIDRPQPTPPKSSPATPRDEPITPRPGTPDVPHMDHLDPLAEAKRLLDTEGVMGDIQHRYDTLEDPEHRSKFDPVAEAHRILADDRRRRDLLAAHQPDVPRRDDYDPDAGRPRRRGADVPGEPAASPRDKVRQSDGALDDLLKTAMKMRGTLGGVFGPLPGMVLDILAAFRDLNKLQHRGDDRAPPQLPLSRPTDAFPSRPAVPTGQAPASQATPSTPAATPDVPASRVYSPSPGPGDVPSTPAADRGTTSPPIDQRSYADVRNDLNEFNAFAGAPDLPVAVATPIAAPATSVQIDEVRRQSLVESEFSHRVTAAEESKRTRTVEAEKRFEETRQARLDAVREFGDGDMAPAGSFERMETAREKERIASAELVRIKEERIDRDAIRSEVERDVRERLERETREAMPVAERADVPARDAAIADYRTAVGDTPESRKAMPVADRPAADYATALGDPDQKTTTLDPHHIDRETERRFTSATSERDEAIRTATEKARTAETHRRDVESKESDRATFSSHDEWRTATEKARESERVAQERLTAASSVKVDRESIRREVEQRSFQDRVQREEERRLAEVAKTTDASSIDRESIRKESESTQQIERERTRETVSDYATAIGDVPTALRAEDVPSVLPVDEATPTARRADDIPFVLPVSDRASPRPTPDTPRGRTEGRVPRFGPDVPHGPTIHHPDGSGPGAGPLPVHVTNFADFWRPDRQTERAGVPQDDPRRHPGRGGPDVPGGGKSPITDVVDAASRVAGIPGLGRVIQAAQKLMGGGDAAKASQAAGQAAQAGKTAATVGDSAAALGPAAGSLSSVMEMAGPVGVIAGAVVTAMKMTKDNVTGVARATGDTVAMITSPNDSVDAIDALGNAAKGASDKLFWLSPIIGTFGGIIGEHIDTISKVMRGIDSYAGRYANYSPDVAQATAIAEVRSVMGDFRRANEIGPQLARYVNARSQFDEKWENFKAKLIVAVLPILEKLLSYGGDALDGIIAILDTLKMIAELMPGNQLQEILNLLKNQNAEEIMTPTEVFLQNRIITPEV